MTKKGPSSITDLIRLASQDSTVYPGWEENRLRVAWYELLPHTKGCIQKIWVYEGRLYLRVNSGILRQELIQQRHVLLARLQGILNKSGIPCRVEGIVFC